MKRYFKITNTFILNGAAIYIRGGSLVRLADPFPAPYVAPAKTTHTSRTGILGRFHARIGKRTSFRNFVSEVGVGGTQMSR